MAEDSGNGTTESCKVNHQNDSKKLKSCMKKSSKYEEKEEKKIELVPPDGGWGWWVVLGTALSNVIVIPIMQSFGLLYRDLFADIGMSATDASVIINVNSAFGMALGLFHGSLLRRYGYRKIAIAGAIIVFVGVVLTSFGRSFAYFLVFYSLITSLGNGVLMPSLSLALNTYFLKRRGKAMGVSTTLMGLGPIFMPLLISFLMSQYGVQGTGLLLGALSLHSLVGALLLQPVKWHMKKKEVDPEENNDNTSNEKKEEETQKDPAQELGKMLEEPRSEIIRRRRRSRTYTLSSSIDHGIDAASIYGLETPILERRNYNDVDRLNLAVPENERKINTYDRNIPYIVVEDASSAEQKIKWWSLGSLETINLGSSYKIFEEKNYAPLKEIDENNTSDEKAKTLDKCTDTNPIDPVTTNLLAAATNNNLEKSPGMKNNIRRRHSESSIDIPKRKSLMKRILSRIVKEFDLTLFKDPHYVNLLIGMSLAITAEINFSLMTPFILGDLSFSNEKTAMVMSTIGTGDIIFRFLSPFFADWMGYDAKRMYLISLFLLISSRTALIFFTKFEYVMAVGAILGIAKGVRTVYMGLVIPSYVPLERLAAASGLQMVCNGLFLLSFGPFIGFIRDVSGTYNVCIAIINVVTATTAIMFITEMCITSIRKKRKKNGG